FLNCEFLDHPRIGLGQIEMASIGIEGQPVGKIPPLDHHAALPGGEVARKNAARDRLENSLLRCRVGDIEQTVRAEAQIVGRMEMPHEPVLDSLRPDHLNARLGLAPGGKNSTVLSDIKCRPASCEPVRSAEGFGYPRCGSIALQPIDASVLERNESKSSLGPGRAFYEAEPRSQHLMIDHTAFLPN